MPTKAYRREIHAEEQQREQRAHARRGQSGENRQRVDEALVQDAQHDVDHQHGHQQQHAQAADRRLERLRRALEAAADRRRHVHLALDRTHAVDGIAERDAGREVERDGHRRQLALVIDGQRLRTAGEPRHGIERNQPAGVRAHVELGQRARVLLEIRRHLQDDLVLRRRAVDGRHLPRAERAGEHVLHLAERDAELRQLVAVDVERDARAVVVEVAGHVLQPLDLAEPLQQPVGPRVQLARRRCPAACTGIAPT